MVDVLSFSTCAAVVTTRGAQVAPVRDNEEGAAMPGSILAARRGQGGYSLSPTSLLTLPAGTTIALPSPNGATCCRLAAPAGLVVTGALVNAGAVAAFCSRLDGDLTVVACGERKESDEDGAWRWALEDDLGAGAILSRLDGHLSPEAEACVAAFREAEPELEGRLLDCESGVELVERGYADDVRVAARLDWLDAVPLLRDGILSAATA